MSIRSANKPASYTIQPGVRHADNILAGWLFLDAEITGQTVQDSSGNGNTLTMQGASATEATDATYGKSFRSDGSGADLTPPAAWNSLTSYTFVSSVKFETAVPAGLEFIFELINTSSSQDTATYGWQSSGNGYAQVEDSNTSNAFLFIDDTLVENHQGEWATFALTLDGVTEDLSLYIIFDGDPSLVASASATGLTGTTINNILRLARTWHGLLENTFILDKPLSKAEVEAWHENPYREGGVISVTATGPTSGTLEGTATYVTEGLTNPVQATFNDIVCSVDNTAFPDVTVTFPDILEIAGTNTKTGLAHELKLFDVNGTVSRPVIITKNPAYFETVYDTFTPVNSLGYNDQDLDFGDEFLLRDNFGSVTFLGSDSSVGYNSANYDLHYIVWDESLGVYSNAVYNTNVGVSVSGPDVVTLGQFVNYSISGLANPVTATFGGQSISVDNSNFPVVSILFPSFNDLPGYTLPIDVSHSLDFTDNTNTAIIGVTLTKEAEQFQTTLVGPAAVDSPASDQPTAVDGDVFLVRDLGSSVTGIAPDTAVAFTAPDFNYDYIWFDVSSSVWSAISNKASAPPLPEVTGSSSATLGQSASYTLTNMTNPVTATYLGVNVTVDNTNFPNVDVTFPDFFALVGSAVELDVLQQLEFSDGTTSGTIDVQLSKSPAQFQVIYQEPAANGSAADASPGASTGDKFLFIDNANTIVSIDDNTAATLSASNYDYTFIYFDASNSIWSAINRLDYAGDNPHTPIISDLIVDFISEVIT